MDARDVGGGYWSEAEAALVGTMPDVELARRLGRGLKAVRHMRHKLGIKPFTRPVRMRRWTLEEDRIIWHLGTVEAVARLPHRNEDQIGSRLRRLRGTVRHRTRPSEFLPPPAWIEEVKNVRPRMVSCEEEEPENELAVVASGNEYE